MSDANAPLSTDDEFQDLFNKAKALALHCQMLGDMVQAMAAEAQFAALAQVDLIESFQDYAAARGFELIDGPPRIRT